MKIRRSPSVENEIDEGDPQNETFRDGMDQGTCVNFFEPLDPVQMIPFSASPMNFVNFGNIETFKKERARKVKRRHSAHRKVLVVEAQSGSGFIRGRSVPHTRTGSIS